jgi:hypothetical protein
MKTSFRLAAGLAIVLTQVARPAHAQSPPIGVFWQEQQRLQEQQQGIDALAAQQQTQQQADQIRRMQEENERAKAALPWAFR